VLKIPLIIKFPFSRRIGREKRIINLTDVFPTILSICELPVPDDILEKPFGSSSSSAVAELYTLWCPLGEHRVIYDGKYKYMEYDKSKEKKPELYDLEKDPYEKENLVEKHPGNVSAMQIKLQKWKMSHKQRYKASTKSTEPLPEELKEELKALGYI
jgi:arylsulfatase A-like enzyme